jgi:hypothetical protein
VYKTFEFLNDLDDTDIAVLHEGVKRDFPGVPLNIDDELRMFDYLIKLVPHEKDVTIRFKAGHARVPGSRRLPLIATTEENPKHGSPAGTLYLSRVTIATLDDFLEEDALRDGFASKADMIAGIEDIYRTTLSQRDVISMYEFPRYRLPNGKLRRR